ncbi:AraC family transcriptional regulator [Dyadobacter sp. CY326]|uniref:AraC family transcriptional regulator n=1 Tax=Dyadobacter sp. CY326 TaxID=2907300 RepID=UPI001F36EEC2|nr:AraC family transcriptional regulator [Dyadobacter sp. CY326]MCE7067542.1 AraC family transcriptional regulator [Dyadobacter sp. CY326]
MIKALFETVSAGSNASFLVNSFSLEKFDVPYHFHPEFELTLILKGKGKRYVGKQMADFDCGDLVLLGSDLPHSWKSEDISKPGVHAKSIVAQFDKCFLGMEFFERPELVNIRNLLKMSAHGIHFVGETAKEVSGKMSVLAREENSFRKMLLLLDILEDLAASKEFMLLDQDGVVATQINSNKDRINAALGYIVDNFRNDIVLNEVAAVVNMSPNAFCKYFKRVTNKTFLDTVIDYRINFAVQQLLSTDRPVSEISFDSGFGDVSHFYKLFKRRMKMSPLSYRKNFQKGL